MSQKEFAGATAKEEVPLYRSNLFKVTIGIGIMVVVFSVLYYPFRDAGMNDFGAKLSSMIIGAMVAIILMRIKGILSKNTRSDVKKDEKISNPKSLVAKNIKRLESQRKRLAEQLEDTRDWQEKVELEKIILDIDSKLLKTEIKLVASEKKKQSHAANMIRKNIRPDRFISAGVKKSAPATKLIKENIHPERLISGDTVKSVQAKSQEKLRHLMKKV